MAKTIPAGLRADLMRKRMEDKATMTAIGGIYMGSPTASSDLTSTNYSDISGTVYETTCLVPGASGLPLVSNGLGQQVGYSQLTGAGIASGAITADKISDNAVTTSKIQDGAITTAKQASNFTANNTTKINNKTLNFDYDNGILTIYYW